MFYKMRESTDSRFCLNVRDHFSKCTSTVDDAIPF